MVTKLGGGKDAGGGRLSCVYVPPKDFFNLIATLFIASRFPLFFQICQSNSVAIHGTK